MPTETKLTLRQLHNQHMDSWGTCPDWPDCPFCVADRQADEREHGDYSSDVSPKRSASGAFVAAKR